MDRIYVHGGDNYTINLNIHNSSRIIGQVFYVHLKEIDDTSKSEQVSLYRFTGSINDRIV